MASPLDNLQQQIWNERSGRKDRYLLVSQVRDERWQVSLWSNSAEGSKVWAGEGDDTRAQELADAIVGGMTHIEERPRGGGLKLFIHVPKPSVTVYLDQEETGTHLPELVDASFAMLSKPRTDTSEVRSLNTQLGEKEAEIASLTAKLLSLRATISRQTATGPKRDGPVGGVRPNAPPPAALNRLQPNQKRRKLVEEEFAGSDDSDEDDDDEGDDDDEEEYDDDD